MTVIQQRMKCHRARTILLIAAFGRNLPDLSRDFRFKMTFNRIFATLGGLASSIGKTLADFAVF
jgi:hypothetical protein